METTIAVKGSTAQLLMMLKEKMKLKSIDEVILKTLQKTENLPQTRFGSRPKMKEFSEKERADSHEL